MKPDKTVRQFLEAGESVIARGSVGGSVDVRTDLPSNDTQLLSLYVTSRRLLFIDVRNRAPRVVWAPWLDEIASVETTVRWQNRVLNRGRERIVVLHLTDRSQVVCGFNHVIEGARRTMRLVDALEAAVHRAQPQRRFQ